MNSPPQNTQYLFLASVGRSGTTIFRRSLGLHPDVYYNGRENNIVQDILSVALRNCTQPSRKVSLTVELAEYDMAFRNLLIDLIWPDKQLRCRPVHFGAINPTGEILDYLRQVFPGGKILCLIRNGIEVVCSRMKYDSFSAHDFEDQCRTWIRSASVMNWGERNPDHFFLFRHEWMYQPQLLDQKLSELFTWSGIAPCVDVAKNISNVVTHPTEEPAKAFDSMSDDEKQDFFRQRKNGWSKWTAAQQDAFLDICGPFMKRNGYPIPF